MGVAWRRRGGSHAACAHMTGGLMDRLPAEAGAAAASAAVEAEVDADAEEEAGLPAAGTASRSPAPARGAGPRSRGLHAFPAARAPGALPCPTPGSAGPRRPGARVSVQPAPIRSGAGWKGADLRGSDGRRAAGARVSPQSP